MPDSPDYSKYLPGSVRFSLQDMSELAVRLGSIDSYDRRGEIVWSDDFSKGIGRYTNLLGGANGSVTLVSFKPGLSGYNMLQQPDTTGSQYAASYVNVTSLLPNKTGLEFSVGWIYPTPFFDMYLYFYNGTTEYIYAVRLDGVNYLLYYLDQTNSFVQNVSLFRLDDPDKCDHHCKMVLDTSTGKYIRFQLDGNSYDLSNFSAFSQASASAARFTIFFVTTGNGTAAQRSYINHIILTANEP